LGANRCAGSQFGWRPDIPGSIGEYSWGGYGGTYFIVDPREKLIAIRMSQAPWSRSYDNRIFRVMLYSALE
jgi:CubicO group peptidase (beta-lactamase class C family)